MARGRDIHGRDIHGRDPAALASALAACRTAFVGVGLLGGVVNLPTRIGSFFMLEVYDRAVPRRSVPTLIGLMGPALALYAFRNALDEALPGRVWSAGGPAGAGPTVCHRARSGSRLDNRRACIGADDEG